MRSLQACGLYGGGEGEGDKICESGASQNALKIPMHLFDFRSDRTKGELLIEHHKNFPFGINELENHCCRFFCNARVANDWHGQEVPSNIF